MEIPLSQCLINIMGVHDSVHYRILRVEQSIFPDHFWIKYEKKLLVILIVVGVFCTTEKSENINKMSLLHCDLTIIEPPHEKSNRKAMSRNWSNQKANPALKTKTGNK